MTLLGLMLPPTDIICKILSLIALWRQKTWAFARESLQFISLMNSTADQISMARLYMQPTSPTVPVAPPCGRPDSQDLGSPRIFWSKFGSSGGRRYIPPNRTVPVHGYLPNRRGRPLNRGDSPIKGVWTMEESKFPINDLEMMTVILAVRAYLPRFRGRECTFFRDNAT